MRNKSLVTAALLATCFVIQTSTFAGDEGSPPHRGPEAGSDRRAASVPSSLARVHAQYKPGSLGYALDQPKRLASAERGEYPELERLERDLAILQEQLTAAEATIKPRGGFKERAKALVSRVLRSHSKAQEERERLLGEKAGLELALETEKRRISDEAEAMDRKAEAERVAQELALKRQTESATTIEAVYRGHKDRQRAKLLKIAKQEKDFLTHTRGWLGGAIRPEDLPKDSREGRLVGWTGSSYNLFNQTESTYDKMAAEYRWVRGELNADRYGVLYDLAVSYRAHTITDSHADNNWIIKSREMGEDNLPGAIKLVRRCTEVLKGKDVTNDGVLKAISDMSADTLVTGGRIGIDLHRQATEAEMAVMIPALRQRGAIALQLAKDNDITEALEALARTFLDAAFKKESTASPNRKAIYNKDRFDSHKAHCFIAAARGAKRDWDEAFEQQVLGKLTDRSMAGMTQPYIKSTKEYYDGFDN